MIVERLCCEPSTDTDGIESLEINYGHENVNFFYYT